MEKGSISIYFVLSALEPVSARGMDCAPLLKAAGISPTLLLSPDSRVTAQNFSALWLAVASVLDDELFAQDSRRMKVGTFAMLCNTLVNCATLNDALRRMTRFFNLILDDFDCSLGQDDHHGHLIIEERARSGSHRILGHETLLMMQHGIACWLVGRRIPVLAAAFAYPEPPRSAEYPRMYSERLCFDQPKTVLAFNRSHLALPVIQNAGTVRDFVRGAPANIVLKYKNSAGLAAQIRRRLRAAPRTEWLDFEAFADSLHMTASTLRRRLDEEGQSFQSIKDQLRRDIAVDYLCHTEKSVADIASELGFAEASAFHRAFRKWTGTRPGEYRLRVEAPGRRTG